MSDEYHDNGQYKGSLVQQSVKDTIPTNNGNYPPPGDTTSEGGSGGDILSQRSQQGIDNTKAVNESSGVSQNSPKSQNTLRSFGISNSQATGEKVMIIQDLSNRILRSVILLVEKRVYESPVARIVYAIDIDSSLLCILNSFE
ncbi:hypothetical protein Clacol_007912 [Clathrus columnatus]|uniref:Uncharacterized protein n=1 Tax=Clathrus columnatus TaxID=1419009 RepID=A0AAV5AMK3_9AGAM|nr:hypothetical protein Clacol_007912 [Clathrus columnatus]